jgi:hypothetical protein
MNFMKMKKYTPAKFSKHIYSAVLLFAHFILFAGPAISQQKDSILTGRKWPTSGIYQHDFLYAGEWQGCSFKDQKMFLVKQGKVVWEYSMPEDGEYGDIALLPNGNILFSRKTGASEITMDKKIVWNYEAENKSEIHVCQPVGPDKVFIVINAVPAKAIILNKITGKVEKEMIIPTGGTNPHVMFRRCRYTAAGTFLVGHLDMNKVSEYDSTGKEIWSVPAPSVWSVSRLENGNTLVGGNQHCYVREFNKTGTVVWELTQKDVPEIKLFNIQEVVRLKNGNTVISNWCAGTLKNKEDQQGTVQFFEVTQDKKIVWNLSSWNHPDLGPASAIQILE